MTTQAFNEYYEKYSRMIFFYALKKCGDQCMAEDVTTIAFIELWNRKEPFESPRHVRDFIFLVTRQRLVNAYVRNVKRIKAYASVDTEEAAYDIDPAERDRLEEEILTKVFEIVESLPYRNKEIFMLTCIKKLSLAHAAKIVGISAPTATRARREAIETIQRALGYKRGKLIYFRSGSL